MKRRVLVSMGFITLLANSAYATDSAMDRATLHGLKALQVAVDVGPELQTAGITRASLETTIRQRLESAGIAVDPKAVEFLGLNLTVAHDKKTPYAVGLELGLYQNVSLKREPAVTTTTETWSIDSVVLSPGKLLQTAITNTLNQLLDQFITAFRSINPAP